LQSEQHRWCGRQLQRCKRTILQRKAISGRAPGGESYKDGNCFQHYSYANETWRFGSSTPSGWKSAIRAGVSEWDKTDGHEFDWIEYLGTSYVEVVNGVICGNANAIGCASNGYGSGNHSTKCKVEFKSTTAWNLDPTATSFPNKWDLAGVAAQEFGHCTGLGHSSNAFATMGGASAYESTAMRHIAYYDKKGRCQIYGHAHHYWGGCGSYGGTS